MGVCLSLQLVCMCVCVSLLNWRVRACLSLSSCCVCVYLSLFSWCVCVCLSLSLQLLPMCLSISLSSAGAYVSVYLFPGHSRACQLSLARTHTRVRAPSLPRSRVLSRAISSHHMFASLALARALSRSASFHLFAMRRCRERRGGVRCNRKWCARATCSCTPTDFQRQMSWTSPDPTMLLCVCWVGLVRLVLLESSLCDVSVCDAMSHAHSNGPIVSSQRSVSDALSHARWHLDI